MKHILPLSLLMSSLALSHTYICDSKEVGAQPESFKLKIVSDALWINGKKQAELDRNYHPHGANQRKQRFTGSLEDFGKGIDGYDVEIIMNAPLLEGKPMGDLHVRARGEGYFDVGYKCSASTEKEGGESLGSLVADAGYGHFQCKPSSDGTFKQITFLIGPAPEHKVTGTYVGYNQLSENPDETVTLGDMKRWMYLENAPEAKVLHNGTIKIELLFGARMGGDEDKFIFSIAPDGRTTVTSSWVADCGDGKWHLGENMDYFCTKI